MIEIEFPAEEFRNFLLMLSTTKAQGRFKEGGKFVKGKRALGLTDENLKGLAMLAVFRIKRRTVPATGYGRDFEDKPFRVYSAAYARRKHKHVKQSVDRSRVNLVGFKAGKRSGVGGLMLASLTGAAQKGKARVYFSNANAAKIANYHNSLKPRRKIPLRRFMDIAEGGEDYKALAVYAVAKLRENVKAFWQGHIIAGDRVIAINRTGRDA